MNEDIPQLPDFDEPSLDAAFATLANEVRNRGTFITFPEDSENLPSPLARPQTRPPQAHQ